MSNVYKILPRYTYEDWVQWEGRWELIEGHPIAMNSAREPLHQRVVADIITEFISALRKFENKPNYRVYPTIDYKISEDTIFEPDVLVVCGKIEKKFLDFPPTVIVEVDSPSSALRDRHTKFEVYQRQGVKYYLMVDIDRSSVEVYMLVEGTYQLQNLITNSFEFTLDEDCKIVTDFSTIDFS